MNEWTDGQKDILRLIERLIDDGWMKNRQIDEWIDGQKD